MDTTIWAAILGSLALVIFTGIGTVTWAHVAKAAKIAEEANERAHVIELQQLRAAAIHADELKRIETDFLKYQLKVSQEYVLRGDHDAILGEIFKKLEALDVKVSNKFDRIDTRLEGKQDKRLPGPAN